MASPACRGEESNTYSQGSKVDKSIMTINFFISRGLLQIMNAPSGNYIIDATSGRDKYMNNPDYTDKKDWGPIPPGSYYMKPAELDDPSYIYDYWIRNAANLGFSDWGDWRIRLHPDKVKNNNRTNLFMHGGQKPGSKGCIDIGGGIHGDELTDRLKKDIADSHQQKIEVTVIR